jgi:carbon storage regulator
VSTERESGQERSLDYVTQAEVEVQTRGRKALLVLSRNRGSNVSIGEDITVTVLSVEGNRVKLGINAPDDVTILRGELNDSYQAPPPVPQNRIRNRTGRKGRRYA